jgi:uncharacterized damage-inducible protein DinB
MASSSHSSSATATPPSTGAVSPKEQFLNAFKQEHATTVKVLRAFPAKEKEFRPHAKSRTARELAFIFVVEQSIMAQALKKQLKMPPNFPPTPESWADILSAFEKGYEEALAALNAASDATLTGKSPFFTGPGQMGDVPTMQLLWMTLCDQIHHRGQLSVYVRMAGGKVPSIYGPSADEPWM